MVLTVPFSCFLVYNLIDRLFVVSEHHSNSLRHIRNTQEQESKEPKGYRLMANIWMHNSMDSFCVLPLLTRIFLKKTK